MYINTLFTFVKKFFYSSQIEFLGHVVEIQICDLLQLISFREGAASDVEIGIEVAGCQVG